MLMLVQPILQPALDQSFGELSIQAVFDMLYHQRAQLWLVYEEHSEVILGAALTEVVTYPHVKALRVILLGGQDMKKWQDLLDEFFGVFCDEQKLDRIELAGREGFKHALRNLGYTQAYTVLIKEIIHG